MTRYMYDSCAGTFPPRVGNDLFLGYVDGKCNLAAQYDVGISSIGTNAGIVLDVEPGNLNAQQAVNWIVERRAAGIDPTVYVAQWAAGYTWADVNAACDARGVPRPWIWLAPWPNDVIPADPQVVAVQFGYVGPYDVSAVRDFWPGVDGPSEEQDLTDAQAAQLQQVATQVQNLATQMQTVVADVEQAKAILNYGMQNNTENWLHKVGVNVGYTLSDAEQMKADITAIKAKLGI